MSCVWIWSDLHLGHKSICKYRTQFSSAEEHDAAIKDAILTSVRKRDTLWLLGDCFFTPEAAGFAYEIPCTINWVPGNHDTDSAQRAATAKALISSGVFNKVGSMFKLKDFWLTHPPIHPLELRGKYNIHGHVHFKSIPDSRYINVCPEVTDFKPVKLQELRSRLDSTS